jgi:hypothetical protein
MQMFASFKKSVAVSLTALTLGLAVVGASTPASAFWHGGGGFHGFHGGWGHGGWGHAGWGHGWGHGCGHGWGYGGPGFVGVGYGPAPVYDAPPPCGIVYRPVFDADGANVGVRPVNTCN